MISRGTNPTITLKIAPSMRISDLENLELTMSQDEYTMVKYLNDMTIDEDNNTCTFDLTLQETNSFVARKSIKYQVRFKLLNGKIIPSKAKTLMIKDVIKDGEF